MRAFYVKIDEATQAKTPAEAIGKLTEAYSLGQPLIKRARARCEFRTVANLSDILRWAAFTCAAKLVGGDRAPWALFPYDGSSSPTLRGESSSLDWRWRKEQEWAETWLPSVPLWTRGPDSKMSL